MGEIAKTDNSKEISKTEQAQKIIQYGNKILPILADFFTDRTITNVKSECIERNLTKGEIAIIMADRIEIMPYFELTGVQNCLMTFCENNINFIEYYLSYIHRDGTEKFQKKYNEWLLSDYRIKSRFPSNYESSSERKKRRKEFKEVKLEILDAK